MEPLGDPDLDPVKLKWLDQEEVKNEGERKEHRRVTELLAKPDLPRRLALSSQSSDLHKLIFSRERRHSETGQLKLGEIEGDLVGEGENKGDLVGEGEEDEKKENTNMDEDLQFVEPLDLITKNVYELQKIIKEKKQKLQKNKTRRKDKVNVDHKQEPARERSGDFITRIWTIGDGPCNSTIQRSSPNVLVLKHLESQATEKNKDATSLDSNCEDTLLASGVTMAKPESGKDLVRSMEENLVLKIEYINCHHF
uniref:WD-40 repeat protein family n=1 Tax=Solanum tuberosum TaxID=4113 RepID=M1C8I2_SOLTU